MVLILKPELEVGYHACSVLFCRQDDVERLRAKLKKKSPDEDQGVCVKFQIFQNLSQARRILMREKVTRTLKMKMSLLRK